MEGGSRYYPDHDAYFDGIDHHLLVVCRAADKDKL